MPFSGTGIFNRIHNWVSDAAAAINITDTRMDAEMDGFANGLTNCVTKDGQTNPVANLPMNGFRHTGVGNSSSPSSYPSTSQVQNGSFNYAVDTGAVNAYVVSLSPAPTAYVEGMDVFMRTANTNTASPTINVNSLGVRGIFTNSGAALNPGSITAGGITHLKYNGTDFRIVGEGNVAYVNSPNIWNQPQSIQGSLPSLDFVETDAALDNKVWRHVINNDSYTLQIVNDANTFASNIMEIQRTATSIDAFTIASSNITLTGPNITLNGTATSLTAAPGTNTTQLATTAFVVNALQAVLLSTKNAVNQSSISFNTSDGISGVYNEFVVVVRNVLPTINSSFVIRMDTNDGASFDAGATDYRYAAYSADDSFAQTNEGSPGASFIKTNGSSRSISTNVPGGGYTGTFRFFGLGNNITQNKTVSWEGNFFSDQGTLVTNRGGGMSNSVTLRDNVVNAIQFLFTSGNVFSGSFRLYGVR